MQASSRKVFFGEICMNARLELALGNVERSLEETILPGELKDLLLQEFNEFRESARFSVKLQETVKERFKEQFQ